MNDVATDSEMRQVVSDVQTFGRVAVILGGDSCEREVSLDTGAAVLAALQSKGVNAFGWDPAERPLSEFADAGFDRAWIALHGTGGEDGALQGALQWMQIPYTGSGVMASALAMDKVRSKRLFRAAGIPTPDFATAHSVAQAEAVVESIGYPLIVKPSRQGSSVGMSKVMQRLELKSAIEDALQYGDTAVMEQCIVGDEITVSILQGRALPSIRISTPRVFYDYRAKYESERTQYVCPGTLNDAEEQQFQQLALAAFKELDCAGWGRVDFMTDANRQPQVLEVNTVPGMTSHSLVPKAASKVGIDFAELCWRILETSCVAADVSQIVEVAAHGA